MDPMLKTVLLVLIVTYIGCLIGFALSQYYDNGLWIAAIGVPFMIISAVYGLAKWVEPNSE